MQPREAAEHVNGAVRLPLLDCQLRQLSISGEGTMIKSKRALTATTLIVPCARAVEVFLKSGSHLKEIEDILRQHKP